MWLHVIDYNSSRLLTIKVGEVPKDKIGTEFSTAEDEFYYDSIMESLGHTNFDWFAGEQRKVEVVDLREENHGTKTKLLELPIGNKSEECYLSVATFKVPITTDILETFKGHQDYLKDNEDIIHIRLGYPMDLDDEDYRIESSHVDIFKDSIYFGAFRKNNTDNYFESEELTIEELLNLLTDAEK